MTEAIVDEGCIPIEIVLMRELHIQPSEIEKLEEEEKWKYFYFITAILKKEKEEMEKSMGNKGLSNSYDTMEFPDDFISFAINRELAEKDDN